MGHDLTRMLRAGMPADWTAGERLVALIIADCCSDATHTGYVSHARLCEETGYTLRGLADVLLRLSRRGFELRVPHGLGNDGRPVFATRGHATDFRVPILKPRPDRDLCPAEKVTSQRDLERKVTPGRAKGHVRTWDSPRPDVTPTPTTPTTTPISELQVVNGSVEGEPGWPDGGAARQPIERAAWLASQQRRM